MTFYIASPVIGYLIGSFPTAFILVRLHSLADIRRAGSGNVGAMNASEVTGSRWLGVAVFLVDAAKGAAAVLIGWWMSPGEGVYAGIAGTAALLGHNFPVWLRGKGGRGLSTAAGMMLLAGWLFVAVWALIWLATRLVSRDVHVGNIAASVLAVPALAALPQGFVAGTLPGPTAYTEFLPLTIVVCLVLLAGHAGPLWDIWKSIKR